MPLSPKEAAHLETEFLSQMAEATRLAIQLEGFTAATPQDVIGKALVASAAPVIGMYEIAERTRSLDDDIDAEDLQRRVARACIALEAKLGIAAHVLEQYFNARVAVARLNRTDPAKPKVENSLSEIVHDVTETSMTLITLNSAALGWKELTDDAGKIRTDTYVAPDHIDNPATQALFEGTVGKPKNFEDLVASIDRKNLELGGVEQTEISDFIPLLVRTADTLVNTPGSPIPVGELEESLRNLDNQRKSFVDRNNPDVMRIRAEINKMLEIISRMLHAARSVGKDLTLFIPEMENVDPGVYGEIYLLRSDFKREFDYAEKLSAEAISQGKKVSETQGNALIDTKARLEVLISRYALQRDLLRGVVTPAEDTLIIVFEREVQEYADWLQRLIARGVETKAGATARTAGTVQELLEGGAGDDDRAAWVKFFRDNRDRLSVDTLRDFYYYQLESELMEQEVSVYFQDQKEFGKYEALIAELNSRGDVDSKNLARDLEYRYRLFDAMNPHAYSAAMAGDTEQLGKKARGKKFEYTVLEHYLGHLPDARENFKDNDVLHEALAYMEDYVYELPDPDYKAGLNSERPDTEWNQVWGTTHKRGTTLFDVRADLQGEKKGRFIKGFFSFWTGNWGSASADIREEMRHRLLFDLEPMFTAKGITEKKQKDSIVQIAIELGATSNIRTVLFAAAYAVGVSPPGGLAAYISEVKDSCPMALAMNDASKNVRLIPDVVEGLVIPQEFLDQMEFLLIEGQRYTEDRDKADEALARFKTLKESIRMSNLAREERGIPIRGTLELSDIQGNEVHPGHGPQGAHKRRKGQRISDTMLLPSWLYQPLYFTIRNRRQAKLIHGMELTNWVDARKEYTDLHHAVETTITYTGKKEDLVKAILIDINGLLGKVSMLKKNQASGNFYEVAELYYRRIGYLIRHFEAQGYDPMQEAFLATWTINAQNPTILDHVRVIAGGGNSAGRDSLITAISKLIGSPTQANMQYEWPKRMFEFPYPAYRKKRGVTDPRAKVGLIDMKTYLLAHLPGSGADKHFVAKMREIGVPSDGKAPDYRRYMLYYTGKREYWRLTRGLPARVQINEWSGQEGYGLFENSYDPKTLMKRKLENEKEGNREGEKAAAH